MPGPFSWSASLHDTFATCRRKHYYAYYYASLGDEEFRRLKMLSALPPWAGSVVNDTIESFLRTSDSLPSGEEQEAPDRKLENALGGTPGPEETDRPGGGRTEGRTRKELETPGTLLPAD